MFKSLEERLELANNEMKTEFKKLLESNCEESEPK